MGGTSKKAGKGGGGGGKAARRAEPQCRTKLTRDPGVPGRALRLAGARLASSVTRSKNKIGGDESRRQTPLQTPRDANPVSEMAKFALLCEGRRQRHDAENQLVCRGANVADDSLSARDEQQEASLRRFKKDFQAVVDASDVLLEVLDARDPLGCRLDALERAIEAQWGNRKQIILILNKADLVPEDALHAWTTFFEEQNVPVLSFVASSSLRAEPCVTALFRELRRRARTESGVRKHVTVGVIGYPNVGKSSIINALKKKNVVGVGNTPGFTTGNVEVDLRGDVRIMDCPGVVVPGDETADVVLRGAVKLERLSTLLPAVARLLERCSAAELSLAYRIPVFDSCEQFLSFVGQRRGHAQRGGETNDEDVARMVLRDWLDGRLPYYTLPPALCLLQQQRHVATAEDGPELYRAQLVAVADEGVDLQDVPSFHLRLNNDRLAQKRDREF